MGKIIAGVVAILILLGAFATPIVNGINNLRTDDATDAFVVATAAGVTSGNVTLTNDLFLADVGHVTAITSTNGTDTPVATTYTEATNVLLITGLLENTSRTLTIEYDADTADQVFLALGPFGNFIVIGGTLGLIIWAMVSKKK